MAVINVENMTPQQIINSAIIALKTFRDSLNNVNDYYLWSSGITLADLTSPPLNMEADTAQGLINAIADAHNEWVNHFNGLPASLPGTGYVYGASQNALIGPNL